MHALLFAIGCYYTRAREALLLFLFYEEGKITVVLLHETRTRRSRTEAGRERKRARERAAQNKKEREAKKYELKNEQTPLLSPHLLSVFVSRNFPQHTRKRGAKQKKSRRRRRRRRERAREEGEGGGSAKTAVFFLALRVFGLSSGVRVCFVSQAAAGTHKN